MDNVKHETVLEAGSVKSRLAKVYAQALLAAAEHKNAVAETGDESDVAVATRGLLAENPVAELVQVLFVEEISQQVDRVAMELGGKLNTADQFEASVASDGECLVVTLESIVIGDAESGYAGATRFRHQLRGRTTSIRFVRVRVEIDQS